MGHIRRKHPDIVKYLNERGRGLATRNNGYGYYDDIKSNNSGWHRAGPSYRETWRMNALREMVEGRYS